MIILALVLAVALAGCDTSPSSSWRPPLLPSPTPPQGVPAPGTPAPGSPTLRVFVEPGTGFSTTDLRDAQEQVVQLNSAGELIWTADGTRLPGYSVVQGIYIPADACRGWMEVRFGTWNGERRAYLTVDYGHDNPGTVVDLDVRGGALACSPTDVYPPGTYALSGVVTEMTPSGSVPVEGASVHFPLGSGYRGQELDKRGFFTIRGLYDGIANVTALKEGYSTERANVSIHGDTRFDIELVRQ